MRIEAAIIPLKEHFSSLDDPRAQHSIEHLLLDIVLITICAVMCGADTCVEIENYGIAKQEWLKPFLELPNGIPFHETFGRCPELGEVNDDWLCGIAATSRRQNDV